MQKWEDEDFPDDKATNSTPGPNPSTCVMILHSASKRSEGSSLSMVSKLANKNKI